MLKPALVLLGMSPTSIFAFVGREFLSSIFVISSVSKFLARDRFRDALSSYRLLPERVVTVIARAVPLIEAALAVLLLTGIFPREAAIASASLLSVFSVAIAINLFRGLNFNCGCFGTANTRPAKFDTLARNIGLIAISVALAVVGSGRIAHWPPFPSVIELFLLAWGSLCCLTVSSALLDLSRTRAEAGALIAETSESTVTMRHETGRI